jgi:hypothetical protein
MADGLSVAASVVGIATAALQSVQFLSGAIANIKDAPDIVQSIQDDLRAVKPGLQKLYAALHTTRC